jgi:hypothetical protein
LADTVVWWTNDDHLGGTVTFELEPASATSCELQMPPDCHLVCARLDSALAQLAPIAANRWNVWLGDNKLPRRLELIFEEPVADHTRSNLQISVPAIIGLPVEQTLWTVIGPKRAGSGVLQEGTSISLAVQDRQRLESLLALGTWAASLLANESAEEIANWCVPWIQRIEACRARLLNSSWQFPTTADHRIDSARRPDVDITALDREFAKIQRRLAIEELAARAAADGPLATEDPMLMAPHGSVTFGIERSRAPSLSVAYSSEARPSSVARITVAFMLALSTALLVWFNGRNGAGT